MLSFLHVHLPSRNPNGLRTPRMDVFVNSNNKRSWNPAKKPHNETLMRQLVSSFRQQDPPPQPRNPLPGMPAQPLLTPEQALMQQQLQQYYRKEQQSARQPKHSRRKRTRFSNDLQRYGSSEGAAYGSSEEAGTLGGSNGNGGRGGDDEDDEEEEEEENGDRRDGGESGGRSETESSYYSVDSDYVYSGFTTIKYNLPFWGHYDTTNQVFMEIGKREALGNIYIYSTVTAVGWP